MIFTDQDLQVLTNFSEINKNFIFKKGKIARTISTMKNILAHYEMETEVPKEFGIYDLKDFLNVYDLFDKPKITISDKKIILKDNRFTSDYTPTEQCLIVAPKDNPNNTLFNNEIEFDYKFKLSANDIRDYHSCRRHSDRLPDLTIHTKEGYPSFLLHDRTTSANTQLSFILNSSDRNKTNHQYYFYLKCENFNRILIGDYDAELREPRKDEKGGVLKLTSLNIPLIYWIALEPKPQPDSKEREDKVNA